MYTDYKKSTMHKVKLHHSLHLYVISYLSPYLAKHLV